MSESESESESSESTETISKAQEVGKGGGHKTMNEQPPFEPAVKEV